MVDIESMEPHGRVPHSEELSGWINEPSRSAGDSTVNMDGGINCLQKQLPSVDSGIGCNPWATW